MSTSAAAQEAAPGGPSYTYTMIDIPNATCVGAYGINDKGQVVLYDCSADPIIPYLWQGGVLTRLPQHPLAGPVGTTPWGISNAGEIVGYYGDANGIYHGFTYQLSTGAWMTVDHPTPANLADNPPAFVWTFLRGIAPNAGESLGLPASYQIPRYTSGSVYNPQRSVMDSNPADTWQDFDGASDPVYGPLNSIVGASGATSAANDINDLGVIVGRRDAPFLDAFVYQGGTSIPTCPLYSAAVTTLPAGCTPRFFTFTFPGAYQTAARGISDGGDVAGWTIDVGLGGGHGYLRLASAQLIQIDAVDPVTNTSYADFTQVLGMNNLRQLVGEVYTQAAWDSTPGPANFNGDGTRAFIATPAAASMPVPAQGCAASSGGCDLSNGTIPHTVSGGPNPLPGTVTESTCAVVPDPRLAQYGTCTGHTLPVAQVCPGFGTTVIPDTLCGGAGPAQNGFVLVDSTAEGVDALSGILVDSEAFADKALGSSPPCPVAVGAWAPRSGSSVEGTIPESPDMVELTGGCGSSKTVSRGLSIYGVGLTLNTAALPGDSLPEKLKIFTAEKYGNLYKTIAEGNMTLAERIKVNACVAISEGLFIFNKTACAAHTIVQCDAQVAANVGNFSSSPSDPNVYGDIRGRLANLYLTINTRILGNEPNTTWPVSLSQAPACH